MTRNTPTAQGQERPGTLFEAKQGTKSRRAGRIARRRQLAVHVDDACTATPQHVFSIWTEAVELRPDFFYLPSQHKVRLEDRLLAVTDGIYQYVRAQKDNRQSVADHLLLSVLTYEQMLSPIDTCLHCGKRTGKLRINPYIEELSNRTVYEHICNKCFQACLEDI